jgi:hypothetical protein
MTEGTGLPRDAEQFFREPNGQSYLRLLQVAEVISERFLLVWRGEPPLYADPESLLAERLRPYLIDETRATSWPGTWIGAGENDSEDELPRVRAYRVSPPSIAIIRPRSCEGGHGPEGLFGWRAPEFPEDLSFYLGSGECWLGTVAHEGEGWIWPRVAELNDDARALAGFLRSEG